MNGRLNSLSDGLPVATDSIDPSSLSIPTSTAGLRIHCRRMQKNPDVRLSVTGEFHAKKVHLPQEMNLLIDLLGAAMMV